MEGDPSLLGGCHPTQCLFTACFLSPSTGKGIKRVKPKRTTSFFSRQLSSSQGSYTVVQPTEDSLEQS